MSGELDFSKLSMDDVKIPGQEPVVETTEPTVDPVVEPVNPEPAVKPDTEPVTPEPVSPDPVVTPKEPVAESPYKFIEEDEFLKGLVDYYKKTKDLTPYLQAKTIDFIGMPDEEIMRRDLREKYPDVSEKAFERLYKQQVLDRFKLDADEWGEDDSELGRELLKSEASKIRSAKIDWQKSFTAPEPEPQQPTVQEGQDQELLKKFEQTVRSSDATRSILEGKRITIKDGESEFNFEIAQPDALLDMTINNDKFFSQFASGEGQVDLGRWYKTAAYSQNPELFERSLINYGKTLGREEITKDLKNPSISKVGDVPTEYEGDFKSGLLQAFADRGVSK